MSTTIESIDARAYLQNWLKGLVSMYTADINAIPDDKWNTTMGGCTKSACDLTADAISLLVWSTDTFRGKASTEGGDGVMAAITADCNTKSGAISKLEQAAAAFNEALGETSEEALQKPVMAPWGMETPLFMIAQISVSHVWYHDGQLNYIQCLLGDDKVHWMGG